MAWRIRIGLFDNERVTVTLSRAARDGARAPPLRRRRRGLLGRRRDVPGGIIS